MKQRQQQNQKQQLKQGYFLSQQHLKLMHLMHLSGFALHEYLSNEVEQNPALEIESENPVESDTPDDDNVFDPELFEVEEEAFEKKYTQASKEEYYEAPIVQFNSLQESLKEQLHQLNLPKNIVEVASYIVDELDDDGYLRIPLEDVTFDYGFAKGKLVDENNFEEALAAIHSCDPVGVGARDLRECLLLQLKRKIAWNGDNAHFNTACSIIENHYELFSQHAFYRLKATLNIQEEEWQSVLHIIQRLSPRPITETNKYELMRAQIIPDFEVTIEEEKIYVSLTQNDAARLKVSPDFEKAVPVQSQSEKKQVKNYFSRLIEDAELLISALKERETSMMKIISVIAAMQPEFFKTGDMKDLKPMILQDVSFATGFDVSTISRVTSNKYVQTPNGIFALKNLFMRNINPDELNSRNTAVGIQDEIKKIVEAEDKNTPLSDNDVARKLHEKGITIARRTVVKYREAIGIPNSVLRKQ